MPQVSIIMPAYKTEEYIENSIQSVLRQSFQDWELIVIDDGSPDNVAVVVENFLVSDHRIKLLRQENQGVSAARNNGIRNAAGKYVTFLDSDDSWTEEFLKKMICQADEEQAQFVYSGYIEEDDASSSRKLGSPYRSGNILESYCAGKQRMFIGGLLVSKEFLETKELFFTVGSRFHEDIEFIIKILTLSEASVVSEELVRYQWRGSSVTNDIKWTRDHKDMLASLKRCEKFVSKNYSVGDKEKVLNYLKARQSTQLSRLLWSAILYGEDKYAHYLMNEYSDIIRYKARKQSHNLKLWVCSKPMLWKLLRKLIKP